MCKSVIIFCLLWQVQFAFAVAPVCQKSEAQACTGDCLKNETKSTNLKDLGAVVESKSPDLQQYNFLREKAQILKDQLNKQKKHWAQTFRKLRDEPTKAHMDSNYLKLKSDFETLLNLIQEINTAQKRLNFCLNNCSASWKLEINDRIEELQKAKIALLVAQPMLASSAIEKILLNEQAPTAKELDQVLVASMSEQLVLMDQKENLYWKFLEDPQQPIAPEDPRRAEYLKKYLESVASRHFEVFSDLYNTFEPLGSTDSNTTQFCKLESQFLSAQKGKQFREATQDIALFALPWLLGPLGRPLAGVKHLSKAWSYGIRAGEGLVIGGANLAAISALQSQCARDQMQHLNTPSDEQFKRLQQCREDLADQKIFMALGATSLVEAVHIKKGRDLIESLTTQKLPIYEKKSLEFYQQYSAQGIATLKKEQDFYITDMDLSRMPKMKSTTSDLASEYFQHVGGVYKARLNLSNDEVDGFVKSSVEMMDRTKLVFVTKNNPSKTSPEFLGGIGLVKSSKSSELLPLEKATGIRVDRSEGNVVEVVRLTVTSPENKELCKDLITELKALIARDGSIKKIYIYTSKIHARLYRSMGLPVKIERELSDRDVLMSAIP